MVGAGGEIGPAAELDEVEAGGALDRLKALAAAVEVEGAEGGERLDGGGAFEDRGFLEAVELGLEGETGRDDRGFRDVEREGRGAAKARRRAVAGQADQIEDAVLPGGGGQLRLVCVKLLVEGQDVAQKGRAVEQRDAGFVGAEMGPAGSAGALTSRSSMWPRMVA